MSTSKVFEEGVQLLFAILKHADEKNEILSNKFPAEINEQDPLKITETYFEYINEHKEEDDVKETSIEQRFEEKHYDSIYKLYHDIKVSCAKIISTNALASPKYKQADEFYRFATQFILQEAYRLNLGLKEFEEQFLEHESQEELTEFAESLEADFDKISTCFAQPNDEALFVLTGDRNSLPLFSSLMHKSELDVKDVQPSEPFQKMQILPSSVSIPAAELRFLSPDISKMPPGPSFTQITRQIFHPNWFSLPCLPWLDHEFSGHFIPLADETLSVVNSKNKGKIYMEQLGYKEMLKAKETEEELQKEKARIEETIRAEVNGESNTESNGDLNGEAKVETESSKPAEEKAQVPNGNSSEAAVPEPVPENGVAVAEAPVAAENGTANGTEAAEQVPEVGKLPINVKNLYEWRPGYLFEDEEIEIIKKGEEQQYINKLLIDLNKLRAERYIKMAHDQSKIHKPSLKERDTYFKVKRMLHSIVQSLKPSDIIDTSVTPGNEGNVGPESEEDRGIRLSKSIPVLAMNYSGTLQAPLPVSYGAKGTQRLQNLQKYKRR